MITSRHHNFEDDSCKISDHVHLVTLKRTGVVNYYFNSDTLIKRHERSSQLPIQLRACSHGGGGPREGEVPHLPEVRKNLAFTCKPAALW